MRKSERSSQRPSRSPLPHNARQVSPRRFLRDSPQVLYVVHFLSPHWCEPSISTQSWDPTIHIHPAYRMWHSSPKGRQSLPKGAPLPGKSSASWTKWIPHSFDIKMTELAFKAQYGEVISMQSISQNTQGSSLGEFFKSRRSC